MGSLHLAVVCLQAPTFIASKTANRADKVTECGSAGSCKILDGEDFFWLVKATVTVGMYSAFTITDTVDDQYFVLGSNAPCKGGLTDTSECHMHTTGQHLQAPSTHTNMTDHLSVL